METVYGAILDYFGNLNLHLIKNENGWATFSAKISSGLNENRYIFAVVEDSKVSSDQMMLNDIDWISFQTRTTSETFNVPQYSIFPDDKIRRSVQDIITIIDRNADETTYRTDSLPIKIRLLHDKKKNNYLQYPDKAKLYQALETFRCVIQFL
jgi:hypothetical protein